MCYPSVQEPLGIPLEWVKTKDGRAAMVYSLLMGKVTEKRNGEHISSRGFSYPIQRPVQDSNAVVGDHSRALHFTSSPESALDLPDGYGSHRLAVLPAPKLWDPPEQGLENRCWHSSGAYPLFCMDCEGVDLDVVNDPYFWDDLGLRSDRRDDDFVVRIPRNSVWNRTQLLNN